MKIDIIWRWGRRDFQLTLPVFPWRLHGRREERPRGVLLGWSYQCGPVRFYEMLQIRDLDFSKWRASQKGDAA